MNAHDHDPSSPASQIGAYALGALDLEDRLQLEALLERSPELQEELRQLRQVVALLPYAATPVTPPARVRERLFARISAARAEGDASRAAAPPATSPRRRMRWLMPGLVAVLTALVVALSLATLSLSSSIARLEQTNRELVAGVKRMQQTLAETEARQEQLAAQLAAGQEQLKVLATRLEAGEERIARLGADLARDDYVISFISAPGVATRQLRSVRSGVAAQGEMYMYPGHSSAVVIFSGLPPLAPGQVYQFWFADETGQVAGETFVVDPTGIGYVVVEAPREVNAFREVMITIEPSGGSATPSQNVILEGAL
ncbi:MAG: anti-sigma factor [Oscillochloridaceae bacterium]|nr:anti-sigma factor [Chloroflexaceae bacterium]MDW8390193.1 anti-sigma factor [Oscillochloridaceae bacterium]